MTDLDLFAMGGGITFIALGGAYAYLRDRYLEGTRRAVEQIEQRRYRRRMQRQEARGRVG